MGTHTQVTPDTEPTPEFDARCMSYVRGWQHGELPASDVVANLKELAREALASRHTANEARAEYLSGYMHHYLGNWNTSIRHYENARKLFDRAGNRRRLALVDINLGENYRYRGDFKRARRLYNQAYEVAVAIGDIRTQTIAVANEGLMLISLQQFEPAQDALRRGLELTNQWEQVDDREALLSEVHYGLAQCAIAINAHELAWDHAQISLEHARDGERMHSVGLAYRILGEAFGELNAAPAGSEFESSGDYYRAAMDIFAEIGAEAEIARTKYSHAWTYARRRRRRHAAQLFHEAMVMFTRLGMTDDAASAAEAQLQVL